MVMHARKPQRINDGYFEKHQTHPYQNSKYSSSKGSYGSGGERYERIRDSPNGNSYRSDSPDSGSPRDRERSYQSKGSYLQKIREKERENRDYKMSREKYAGECRSPKDKRSRDKDSEHRTNHDRSAMDDKLTMHPVKVSSGSSQRDRKPMHNCQDKQREERSERVTRVGDWSEHISSSGKKYYYNCKTEVSQWEKPREWVERERERDGRFRGSKDSGPGGQERAYGRSSTHADKHSSSSNSRAAARDKGGGGRHWSNCNREETPAASGAPNQESHDPRRKHIDGDMQTTQQDMDISPGDSTPTSEMSYSHHTPGTSRGVCGDQQQQASTPQGGDVDSSGTPTHHVQGPVLLAQALPRIQQQPEPQSQSAPAMVPPPSNTGSTCNTPGPPPPVTLASLPRILSQITGSKDSQEGANHQKALQTIQNAIMLSRQGSVGGQGSNSEGSTDGNGPQLCEGPPTPTHSESQDCMDARKSLVTVTSPPASLSSLQGVASLRSTGPTITPSLSNYYRDDLVNHVRGWPADILEKQAQKLGDEAHVMGSLQCTKVSAELKSARSVVRLTEIQATLQEQRILFLRQQIKMLEDMKAQNSFMSDDL